MGSDTRLPGRDDSRGKPLLVAVVAAAADDRAALSTAFAAQTGNQVTCSASLEAAEAALAGQPLDAIVGFVEDSRGWQKFRELAARFAEALSVVLVSDPDELEGEADGRVLNAVATLPRQHLAERAAEVAAEAAEGWGARRTPAWKANELDRSKLETLSEREREVLALTARGLAIKEIAREIDRTYATVATHRTQIMKKLALHDKVALALFAVRVGLIEP